MTKAERLELLKQIEKDIYVPSIESTFLDDAKNCAIHSAIEELEQKPKTGDWILVSERLPENTQPVLMTIRRMSKLYNHEPFITVGYISWNQTTWWCAHDGDCVRNEIEVLAWMPLPEPYKAESEEE